MVLECLWVVQAAPVVLVALECLWVAQAVQEVLEVRAAQAAPVVREVLAVQEAHRLWVPQSPAIPRNWRISRQ